MSVRRSPEAAEGPDHELAVPTANEHVADLASPPGASLHHNYSSSALQIGAPDHALKAAVGPCYLRSDRRANMSTAGVRASRTATAVLPVLV